MGEMGGDSGGDSNQGGDNNQGGDSGDGKDNNDEDSSDDIPKDAPQTTGALTAGGDSDDADDDNDDSEGNRDNDNDNDNEPTSKDAPQTADTTTANKPECPAGQEYYLFSASCKPVGGSDSTESATSVATVDPKTAYVPPAAALPYRGNEIELIESYNQHNIDNVKKYDTNGKYGRFTFNDGTIKEGTYGKGIWNEDDNVILNIKIIPGSGTPLDRLGVKEARLSFSEAFPEVHYKDGKIVYTRYEPIEDIGNLGQVYEPIEDIGNLGQVIRTIDAKGNVLETTVVDEHNRKTYTSNPNDGSVTKYKEDGSYITTWQEKADGSQQFYDSKQQKVFVRDADGNIIPPKE